MEGPVVGVQCSMCGRREILRGRDAERFTASRSVLRCDAENCLGYRVRWPSAAPGNL